MKKSYDHSFCSDNEVHCQNIWYDRSLALKTSDLLELPYDRDRLDLGRKEKNACLPPYILFIALFPTLCFKFLYKVRSSIVLLLELAVFTLFRPLLIILNGKNQTKDNILLNIELSFLLRKIDTCSLNYSLFDCKLFIAYHAGFALLPLFSILFLLTSSAIRLWILAFFCLVVSISGSLSKRSLSISDLWIG